MAVFIRGQRLQTSSEENNCGVFIGQNIQHSWDAFVTEKQAAAYSMGDGNWMPCGVAGYVGWSAMHQPIGDQDWKDNFVWSTTR